MQELPQARNWYLVYTKPRQEELAFVNLRRQGYDAYLPRCRHARRRQGKTSSVIEPLFPRYLFICLDTQTDNWGPIRSTFGVTSMVRFGERPAPVPSTLIDFLKSREGLDGIHDWADSQVHAGERVRLVNGPMEGYEGILLARTSRERVVVLLELLGKQVKIHIDLNHLERSS